MQNYVGRFLLVAGAVIFMIGVLFSISKGEALGRMWGDFHRTIGSVRIIIPVVTCVLASILITLVVNFFTK